MLRGELVYMGLFYSDTMIIRVRIRIRDDRGELDDWIYIHLISFFGICIHAYTHVHKYMNFYT